MTQLFEVGDQIGGLTITKYLGAWALDKKGAKNRYTTDWYDLRCECGAEVKKIYQARLRGKRRRTSCIECAAKKRSESIKSAKSIMGTDWKKYRDGWNIFDLWPAHSTDWGMR